MTWDLKTIVLAAAALLLTGCVPSLNPLYTDRDLTTDTHLPGTWSMKEGSMAVTVDGRGYKVVYTVKEKPEQALTYAAHVLKLGDSLFVDILPTPSEDLPCYPCMPMHMFAKLVIEENSLRLNLLDPAWFDKKLKAG